MSSKLLLLPQALVMTTSTLSALVLASSSRQITISCSVYLLLVPHPSVLLRTVGHQWLIHAWQLVYTVADPSPKMPKTEGQMWSSHTPSWGQQLKSTVLKEETLYKGKFGFPGINTRIGLVKHLSLDLQRFFPAERVDSFTSSVSGIREWVAPGAPYWKLRTQQASGWSETFFPRGQKPMWAHLHASV